MDGRIKPLLLGLALMAGASCQQPVSCVAIDRPGVTGDAFARREASSTVKCYDAKGELISVNGNPVTVEDGQRIVCTTVAHKATERLVERCVTLEGEVVRESYVGDPAG